MYFHLMRCLPLAILLLGTVSTTASVNGSVDFQSVRRKLLYDASGSATDPPQKYFHESTFHPHYDGRFADKPLPVEDQRTALVFLIQTYLYTMRDLGAETWLMHGTMIGWWWNRKILPWDSDIDVQMTVDTMSFLYRYYQLATFHFKLPGVAGGRDYLLEINPEYHKETEFDNLNMIDARWIDMDTGVFIDITALRPSGAPGLVKCKDTHYYKEGDIFPLRDSIFENIKVKIPNEYTSLIEAEYTRRALYDTKFEGYTFNSKTMEWELDEATDLIADSTPTALYNPMSPYSIPKPPIPAVVNTEPRPVPTAYIVKEWKA